MKAFIITLSKISESLDSANRSLDELKKQGFDAELFEGTYGNLAEILFTQTNRTLYEKADINSTSWKTISPGVKGCFHSHYRLWEKCVDLNEPIAIFEDDVIFYRQYENFDFEDVQILAISYIWNLTKPYRKYLDEEHPLEKIEYKLNVMPGAAGYIIKPHAAKKLVELYKDSYLPADHAINSSVCKLELHPRPIGRPNTDKESLTRTKRWSRKKK